MKGAFTTNPVFLSELLGGLKDRTIQLPEFQRGWVWDDERIRSVLASVSRSFPIGAVMMLEAGGEARFKTRPVEGVPKDDPPPAKQLILDGQQRLTSLFQALMLGRVVETVNARKQPIKVWFYIDMMKALADPENRQEAFIVLPESRIRRALGSDVEIDASSPDKEYASFLFPCSAVFDPAAWRREFNIAWGHDPEKSKLFDRFEKKLIEPFKHYQLPVITLTQQVSKEAVCHVFEKVNTGGVTLTAFELLTATFAAESFQLRRDWLGPEGREGAEDYAGVLPKLRIEPVLRGTQETEFLQAVTLMATLRARKAMLPPTMRLSSKDPPTEAPPITCTRKAILDLPLKSYLACRHDGLQGFLRASKFLIQQNLYSHRDLPYQSQLVPLAVILAELGARWEDHAVTEKIRQWYWCGVFGELYGSAVETRFAKDVPEVLDWISGGSEPSTVRDSSFNPGRLLGLRTRGSAAYKGLYALLMGENAYEWLTGTPLNINTYRAEKIDIHHVFPKAWCRRARIDRRRMDCIVNKTAISARTNRKIGGRAPSIYLQTIMRDGGPPAEKLHAYLRSHSIEPEHLRADDFEAFFAARKAALLDLIQQVTGRPLPGESPEPEPVGEDWDEEDADDEAMETAA